jgi:predicted GNAT family acetyltransferase
MSTPAPGEITVQHNATAGRFEARVGAQLAVADYVLEEGRIVFTHTYVPTGLRGHGVAEKLVRAGLEFAKTENRRVVPQCSYVAIFIERHKEFQPLLA